MDTGILHLHITSVSLFLIVYLVKAYYLLTDRKAGLHKWSKWTKVPEMVLSLLFLLTGIYLAVKMETLPFWFWVKITAVIASIPLAVVGVKKENKAAMSAAVLLLLYAFGVARSRNLTFTEPAMEGVNTNPQSANYNVMEHGAAIYEVECKRCHGSDGKLGLQGASNLATSNLSLEQRVMVITMGRSVMPSYQNKLKPEEIQALAYYLDVFIKEQPRTTVD